MEANSSLRHIAMIMDGNGRWAQQRGLARSSGHEEGAQRVRDLTVYCSQIGVEYLTLYAFSTENWKRPKIEVEFLMKLISRYLKNELPLFVANNVRFETIGDLSQLSKSLQKEIQKTKDLTAHHTGLTQVIAINYGACDEIVRASRRLCLQGLEITHESLEKSLDTGAFPPVDMMIRTGGDMRLSNFLLWQSAYAELFFTPTLWPDMKPNELDILVQEYQTRQRRFGGI